MTILLNIGNTHTQVAELAPDGPRGVMRVSTRELLQGGRIPGFAADARFTVVAACVVPEGRSRLVAGHPHATFHFIGAASVPDVDFSLVDTRTLGADRIANVARVACERMAPVVILDCGTAITTEVVDSQYRFRGGAILPGRLLLRRALNVNTGQLPEVADSQEKPAAIGGNTVDAIRAGVDLGTLGAVRTVLDETRVEMGPELRCPVVAVGGDADFFVRHLPGLERGSDDFTLQGLAAIARSLAG